LVYSRSPGGFEGAHDARFFEERVLDDFEERVLDELRRLGADLRSGDCPASEEAESFFRAASTRLSSASARLPAAWTAFFAVPPTALAASATCPAASLAELLSCDSLRFAAARLRVAAAFSPAACR
jgi:hypothetical protein